MNNWEEVFFTDVLDISGGTQPPKSEFIYSPQVGYVRLLQIRDFGKKEVPTYVPDLKKLKKCETDDILIGRYGASVGKILTGKSGAYNVAIAKVIIPELINKRYIYHFLNSEIFQSKIKGIQRSAQNGFNKDDLSNIKIPICPLNEQKRIANKLDQTFQHIDSLQNRLNSIPELLKQFRKMILQKAVSGELTKEWRENNSIEFDESLIDVETNKIGWKKQLSKDCCSKVQSGSTPKNSPFTTQGEIPFLKVYNIVDQKISFDYKPQFITKKLSSERSIVYPNDILMNIVGPPLGKIALVTDQFSEWNINQAIVLFRPKGYLLSKFLYYVLCNGREIDKISLELKGSAGQQNISLTQSRNFVIDIPSLKEQEEILKIIEKLFLIADQIESKFKKTKQQLDTLPQQLLTKAFRGELVAQDPNDEPAEKLLEQIKQEIDNLKTTKKKLK